MTDQEHAPTEQEQAIYDALTAGDHDTIEQMHAAAIDADDAEQYNVDYGHATAHYQADHEPSEEEREENTADATHEANTDAAERQEGLL